MSGKTYDITFGVRPDNVADSSRPHRLVPRQISFLSLRERLKSGGSENTPFFFKDRDS